MAQLLSLAYQIRSHRFGAWALDRWAVTIAWGVAAVVSLQWVARGRPVLPLWHWLVLALLVLAGAGLLALHAWAARRDYVVFTPEPGRPIPGPCALTPDDKVAVWATGRFAVEKRVAFFANLQAFWRTFATGEHAVMAIRHRSRFFLLGQVPQEQLGMWYIFVPAEALDEVTPGSLAFGAASGPALRLCYRRIISDQDAKKATKSMRETVYLMLENEPARTRVWADLVARR